MIKKSQQLEPVRALSARKEEMAAIELGKSLHGMQEEKQRLDDLMDYREEYIEKFNDSGKAGINGSLLKQYQAFINQLNGLIGQQQNRLAMSVNQYELTRSKWQKNHHRTQALDKTLQNYAQLEVRKKNRKETREIEDAFQSRLGKTR